MVGDAKGDIRSGFPHLLPRVGSRLHVSIVGNDWDYPRTNITAFHSRIYVDNRLHHMMVLNINKSFWDRGEFPQVINNGSEYIALTNPWTNGTLAAPFDKRTFFFLVYIEWTDIDTALVQPSI